MSMISDDAYESGADDQVVDTVALLQEEIARLECELRLRDELESVDFARSPSTGEAEGTEARDRRISELVTEVAEREKTIEALWEQVGILEAAEISTRNEWERLNRWVEELEQRVDRNGGNDPDVTSKLEASLREIDELRQEFARDRHTWATRRRALEEETASLQKRLEKSAQQRGPDDAQVALERENRRLRQECHRLAAAEAMAASAEDFRGQLNLSRKELEEVRREVSLLRAQLDSQRIEHEAELAAVQSQSLRERSVNSDGLTLNERMRALREHLSELHDQEEEERRQRRLSTRISRLWTRTAMGV